MAYGYFRLVTPLLTYAKRASFKADPTSLPSDPSDVAAPVEGELVTINASGVLVRPTNVSVPAQIDADYDNTVYFPLLVDKSRTDVQSNANSAGSKLTVLLEKGAMVDTDQYAKSRNGGSALTYAPKADLIPCLWRENDAGTILRCGFCPSDATVGTPSVAGDLEAVATNTNVIATVIRGAHSESGVGVGSRRTVITILTK